MEGDDVSTTFLVFINYFIGIEVGRVNLAREEHVDRTL
jgi:hypothetical protein